MISNPVRVTDTILRDAHQSLLATRMSTGDMLPVAHKLDQVGYHSLEMWGGATFDAAMRFLHEDPWERLRRLRAAIPNTRLQMLLRGQNLLGYRHYPDDIVDKFVALAIKNGMNIFRIFDALNDARNMEAAIQAVKRHGGHVQGAISYTVSPVHTHQLFAELALQLKAMGADTICVKDMSGICSPYDAYALVKRLKAEVGLPIQFHTHDTAGFGLASVIKAAEAGADVVDTAISSMAGGVAQPATESFVATMRGTERDTGLDLALLSEIAAHFQQVRAEHLSRFEAGLNTADVRVLLYQVPGGMLSNLVNQLREQNALHRYEEALLELPRVREDLGFPPLVTPMSQMVGAQAVMNVMTGERYRIILQEVRDYCLGLYGRPPAEINPDVFRMAVGDREPITVRPADLLEPGFDQAKQEIGDLAQSEEDVISFALFPREAREFFELRRAGRVAPIEEPRVFAKEGQAPAAAARPKAVAATPPADSPSPPYSLWKVSSRR